MLDRPTKPPLTIRLCQPRGFCAGVDRAIQIVVLALKKYGAPVYVRHEIVHNRYVVEGLQKPRRGVHRGTGRDPGRAPRTARSSFRRMACRNRCRRTPQARNLFYLDATCPLVSKVHKQAMRHQRLGRHVLLIGHAGHPEVIGTMGQLPEGAVTLIETEADVARFVPADPAALGFVTQTTLSVEDTAGIIRALQERFPELHGAGRRIDLLRHHQPPGGGEGSGAGRRPLPRRRRAELVQFAGASSKSPNAPARRCRCWCSAPPKFRGTRSATISTLGLSAGASAPEIIVDEIIDAFRARFDVTVDLAVTATETENFPVMRALRDVELTAADMAFVNG